MKVTSPDGTATRKDTTAVVDTIESFAKWTDREGVCVPEIRLVASTDEDLAHGESEILGRYQGPRKAILISSELQSLDRVTRHELCHALDHEEGISSTNEDLFPADDAFQSESIRTDEERSREAFALACQNTPTSLSVSRYLYEACGMSTPHMAASMLLEDVYPAANPSSAISGTEEVSLSRHPFDFPLDSEIVSESSADGFGLLLIKGRSGSDSQAELDLLRFEFDTEETTIVALNLNSSALTHPILLTGSGVVLLLDEFDGVPAWRINIADGTASALSTPDVLHGQANLVGTVVGQTAWISVCVNDNCSLYSWNIDTNTTDNVQWPADSNGVIGSTTGIMQIGGQLAVSTDRGLFLLDLASIAWRVVSIPGGGNIGGLARDGENRIVTTIYDYWSVSADMKSLLFFDMLNENWTIPIDPCGRAAVLYPNLMVNGDEAWLRERSGEDTDSAQFFFSKILFDK